MRAKLTILLGCLGGSVVLLPVASLRAQDFTSGSQGTEALVVSVNTTIDVPPDGILHYTTVTIDANRVLTFRNNELNTPVTVLASGNVAIAGLIRVNGQRGNDVVGGLPGPGGFAGGNPGSLSVPPGDGLGPGGGQAGPAEFGATGVGAGVFVAGGERALDGEPYGNALMIPMVGGSGGGGTIGNPGRGGGSGGGALLLVSTTEIHLMSGARIESTGGGNQGGNNGGSGGAVRLVAPKVYGQGSIDVNRGSNFAGPGRIRVDTLDRSNLGLSFSPGGVTSIGSMMLVFPDPLPRLDVIQVADRTIPPGSGPVVIQLPFGSDPNIDVRVQASQFGDRVPITVALFPDNGSRILIEAEIDNRTSDPASVIVPVQLPVNVQTTVHVWTR